MSKTLKIYTDGGSRGNPGMAGVGIYVTDEANKVVYKQASYLGIKTNNESEYEGFLLSAKWLINEFLTKETIEVEGDIKKTFKPKKIEWYLDSKLVVEQLNKNWKIKEPRLRLLAQQCWEQLSALPHPFTIQHVLRNKNGEADALANLAMDSVK